MNKDPDVTPSSTHQPTPTQTSRHTRNVPSWVRWLLPCGTALAVIGVMALLAYGLIKSARGSNLVSQISAGKKPAAPEFQLEPFWPTTGPASQAVARAIHNGMLDLHRLRGHPVVLNFWASWCVACRAEATLLADAQATRPSVVFIGVDVQDLRDDAIGFLRRYHVSYTAVWDKTNTTYQAYGLTGVPETYYIDPRGRIVAHDAGPVSGTSLAVGIRKAGG